MNNTIKNHCRGRENVDGSLFICRGFLEMTLRSFIVVTLSMTNKNNDLAHTKWMCKYCCNAVWHQGSCTAISGEELCFMMGCNPVLFEGSQMVKLYLKNDKVYQNPFFNVIFCYS